MPAEFFLGLLAEESVAQVFGLAKRGFSDSEHQSILRHVMDSLKEDLPPGRDGSALYEALSLTLGGNKPSWYTDGILEQQPLRTVLLKLLLPINDGEFQTGAADPERGISFLRRVGWDLPRMVAVVETALINAVRATAVDQGRLPEVLRQSDMLRINAALARIEAKADVSHPNTSETSMSASINEGRVPDPKRFKFFMPAGSATLAGREDDFRKLAGLMASCSENRRRPDVVIIHGMAGVGKTAFCIEFARRLAGDEEIGNVPFIDLKGWAPNTVPLPPVAALEQLLASIGHPMTSSSLEGRLAQWQSVIQSRNIRVIILDSAFSSEQVRPLLDIDSQCVILVTSRDRLPAIQDATRYELSIVSIEATRQFLWRAARSSRASIDETSIDRLVHISGCLPLAFRVIAARLAESQSVSLADLVAELSDRKARLRGLHIGDLSVIAAIDVSYQRLSDKEKRALGFLALLPSTIFRPDILGPLVEISMLQAKQILISLERQAILQFRGDSTWQVHDLIWSHIRSESSKVVSEKERNQAFGRIPIWWRAAGQAAGEGVQFFYLDTGQVAVRDGKNPSETVLLASVEEWDAFLDGIRAGEFDEF